MGEERHNASSSSEPELTEKQKEHAEAQKVHGRAFAVAVDAMVKGMVLFDNLHPMAAFIVLYEASQRLRMSIKMSQFATEIELDEASININRHLEKHLGELGDFIKNLRGKSEQ